MVERLGRIIYCFDVKGSAKQILSSNLKEERFVVEAPWMMYRKVNQRKTTFINIISSNSGLLLSLLFERLVF